MAAEDKGNFLTDNMWGLIAGGAALAVAAVSHVGIIAMLLAGAAAFGAANKFADSQGVINHTITPPTTPAKAPLTPPSGDPSKIAAKDGLSVEIDRSGKALREIDPNESAFKVPLKLILKKAETQNGKTAYEIKSIDLKPGKKDIIEFNSPDDLGIKERLLVEVNDKGQLDLNSEKNQKTVGKLVDAFNKNEATKSILTAEELYKNNDPNLPVDVAIPLDENKRRLLTSMDTEHEYTLIGQVENNVLKVKKIGTSGKDLLLNEPLLMPLKDKQIDFRDYADAINKAASATKTTGMNGELSPEMQVAFQRAADKNYTPKDTAPYVKPATTLTVPQAGEAKTYLS